MKRAPVVLALTLALGGCERAMHDMYDQPRYRPLRPAPALPQGTSSQPLPADSVVASNGPFAATSSGHAGREAAAENERVRAATSMPYAVTPELLRRGEERYSIYCVPCHSPLGDGDGRVARRGFPHPPSYHIARLREAPDRHFYDVMTDGYGIMYSYADRVSPSDRWAIVAYIRALQLSQHADASRLPADVRAKLPER
jgi:mono/diheme cytochrome c family protein